MLGPVGYTKSVSYCGFTKLEVKQLGPQLSLGCSVAAPAKLLSFLFGSSFSPTLPLKNGGPFLVDNIETVPYYTVYSTLCRYKPKLEEEKIFPLFFRYICAKKSPLLLSQIAEFSAI